VLEYLEVDYIALGLHLHGGKNLRPVKNISVFTLKYGPICLFIYLLSSYGPMAYPLNPVAMSSSPKSSYGLFHWHELLSRLCTEKRLSLSYPSFLC